MSKIKSTALFLGIVAMSLFAGIFAAAWTEPSLNPPTGNAAAPLNVSSADQWKEGRLGIGTASQGIYWLKRDGDSLFFQNKDNQTKMVIGRDGNIGIGTTGPSQKLEINGGNIIVGNTGASTYPYLNLKDTTIGAYVQGATYDTFLTNNARNTDGANWARDNTSYGSMIMRLRTAAGGKGQFDLFQQTSGAGTFVLPTPSLTMDTEGNVGIGTTAPTQKLDVSGYVKGSSGLCIGSSCRTSWPATGLSGYEIVSASCGNVQNCRVQCPSGKFVSGGGCQTDVGWYVRQTYPDTSSSWRCIFGGSWNNWTMAYAICVQ